MGSGKTTAGKKLASALGYTFIDLDDYIEKLEKKSIAKIFEDFGEDYFRNIERTCLNEVSLIDNIVVSTGGGAPCFYDNMQLMNSQGVTVYLKMTPQQLYSRLKDAVIQRPLLSGKSPDELIEYIKLKLLERESFYLQATHIVEGTNLKTERLVKLIDK
jgi:shikimate kinase